VQTAHRDVTGMNSKDPKPQSGSILAVLKGIRRLKIRDTVYTLSPGQAIWFDGDVLHNGMDNPPDSLALQMHIDDKSFFRVAYDFDLEE
jgi:quercetin dioxygenase-like cupin family protein